MRPAPTVAPLLLASLVPAAAARAHPYREPHSAGALVSVSVEIDERAAPLYSAPDGSGRYYVEARRGGDYSLRVTNRTGERLAVLVAVDGLNVIDGNRQLVPRAGQSHRPGRMYVLDPWGDTLIQGWRTSLEEVRRFTFVDEERSYATRSGKANARMGWIEVAVYRERRPRPVPLTPRRRGDEMHGEAEGRAEKSGDASRDQQPRAAGPATESYPGTGWGRATDDHAVEVAFDAAAAPAETVVLRYEYASGLRALGIVPRPWWAGDRLHERDRGDGRGFAEPPRW